MEFVIAVMVRMNGQGLFFSQAMLLLIQAAPTYAWKWEKKKEKSVKDWPKLSKKVQK